MNGAGIVTLTTPIACADGVSRSTIFAKRWQLVGLDEFSVAVWLERGEQATGSNFLAALDDEGRGLLAVPREIVLGWVHAERAPDGCYALDDEEEATCTGDTSTSTVGR